MTGYSGADIFAGGMEFVEKASLAIAQRVASFRPITLDDYIANLEKEELTHPGGLVEEIVDWIVASSDRPSRQLALAGVLPFVGSMIGRRFASTEQHTKSNIYVIALAPSGYGKEHARAQLKLLAEEAKLSDMIGMSHVMSASALRKAVMRNPSSLSMIDEVDSFFAQINDPRAGTNQSMIKADLKEFFSTARNYFSGAEYSGTPAVKIHHPNFSIYGTGTPDAFTILILAE